MKKIILLFCFLFSFFMSLNASEKYKEGTVVEATEYHRYFHLADSYDGPRKILKYLVVIDYFLVFDNNTSMLFTLKEWFPLEGEIPARVSLLINDFTIIPGDKISVSYIVYDLYYGPSIFYKMTLEKNNVSMSGMAEGYLYAGFLLD